MTETTLPSLSERLERANVAAQHFDKWPESPVRETLIEVCRKLCVTCAENGLTCDPGEIIQKPFGEISPFMMMSYGFKFFAWRPTNEIIPQIERFMCGAFLILQQTTHGDISSEEGQIMTDCPFITDSDLYGLPINQPLTPPL